MKCIDLLTPLVISVLSHIPTMKNDKNMPIENWDILQYVNKLQCECTGGSAAFILRYYIETSKKLLKPQAKSDIDK